MFRIFSSLKLLAIIHLMSLPFGASIKNYHLFFENVYLCKDNDQLETPMKHASVTRYNRTHRFFNVEFSLAAPLGGPDSEAILITEKWTDGKWTPFPIFPHVKNPCILMTKAPPALVSFATNFFKAAGKDPGKCPFPAGNYSVRNYPADVAPGLIFVEGKYRATAFLKRIPTKKKVICATFILSFEEVVN